MQVDIIEQPNFATSPSKSVFTCTSTRQTAQQRQSGNDINDSHEHEQWLAEQQQSFAAYRRCLHESFLQRCELEASATEKHRQVAVKMLCAEAARYHVAHAKKFMQQPADAPPLPSASPEDLSAPPLSFADYEKSWWTNFGAQVNDFFKASHLATACTVVPASQQATENISSLGVWYVGQGISMSSRQYSVLTLSHHVLTPMSPNIATDEQCDYAAVTCTSTTPLQYCSTPVYKSVVLIGLCQFAYSNFVQSARAHAQTAVLQFCLPQQMATLGAPATQVAH